MLDISTLSVELVENQVARGHEAVWRDANDAGVTMPD